MVADEAQGPLPQEIQLLGRHFRRLQLGRLEAGRFGLGQGHHRIVDALRRHIPGAAAQEQGNQGPGEQQAAENGVVDIGHGANIKANRGHSHRRGAAV